MWRGRECRRWRRRLRWAVVIPRGQAEAASTSDTTGRVVGVGVGVGAGVGGMVIGSSGGVSVGVGMDAGVGCGSKMKIIAVMRGSVDFVVGGRSVAMAAALALARAQAACRRWSAVNVWGQA